MSRELLLFLGCSTDAPIDWAAIEDGGVVETGQLPSADTLEALITASELADQVYAILPGEQVAIRQIATPPKSQSKFQSAAAYMLEDVLSEPLDGFHYVAEARGAQGNILAVKSDIVETWVNIFRVNRTMPDGLYVDAQLLIDQKANYILRDRSRTIFASVDGAAACENELFDEFGREFFLDTPLPVRFLGEESQAPDYISAEGKSAEFEWLGPATIDAKAALFSKRIEETAPVNLLQGKFKARASWRGSARLWRRPAAAAACAALFLVTSLSADAWREERIASRWKDLTKSLHEQAFPDNAVSDPVSHARAVLSNESEAASFLALNTQIADALDNVKGVEIDRIGYDQDRRRITVAVKGSSHDAIEALRAALNEVGLEMRDNGGFRRARGQIVGELLAEWS